MLAYISYAVILNGILPNKTIYSGLREFIMNIHGADLVINLLALLESERTRENEETCSAIFDTMRILIGLL